MSTGPQLGLGLGSVYSAFLNATAPPPGVTSEAMTQPTEAPARGSGAQTQHWQQALGVTFEVLLFFF